MVCGWLVGGGCWFVVGWWLVGGLWLVGWWFVVGWLVVYGWLVGGCWWLVMVDFWWLLVCSWLEVVVGCLWLGGDWWWWIGGGYVVVGGCLTSPPHDKVHLGNGINCKCCHTVIETEDQTCCLTHSQFNDTGQTSPSSDPITPGVWQREARSTNVQVMDMTQPVKGGIKP